MIFFGQRLYMAFKCRARPGMNPWAKPTISNALVNFDKGYINAVVFSY
jgi:hypothetical protein